LFLPGFRARGRSNRRREAKKYHDEEYWQQEVEKWSLPMKLEIYHCP
jgi:hypothetical protein